jgi:hypothetical protein
MRYATIADRLWSALTEHGSQAADDGDQVRRIAAATPIAVASTALATRGHSEAAMSGQRRTARLEIRARALRDREVGAECRRDRYVSTVER